MPPSIKEKIEVPKGIELKVSGRSVEVSGPKGKLSKTFRFPDVKIAPEGKEVAVEASSKRRRDKAAVGTILAHLRNMFKGVTKGFVYKMRVVYSHFPITVKVEGKRVSVNNFLGERHPRFANVVGDVKVEVNGDEVLVSGINKEDVGQTAVNIERSTRVTHRDRRIFQDGCYIVEVT
jgi:large subunit ribosomal protein L6